MYNIRLCYSTGSSFFFFQAEDGRRYLVRSRGLGDVYKRQPQRKKSERSADLRNRIRELERQLEDEQLKSEAYSKLIDLAESEHRIAIRKKANTK